MKNLKQYSKKVIRLMIILWFMGAAFGAAVIIVEIIGIFSGVDGYSMGFTIHLPELLTYIGTPVGGGIVGYMCKSAWEKKYYKPEYDSDYQNNGGIYE